MVNDSQRHLRKLVYARSNIAHTVPTHMVQRQGDLAVDGK
jgi:hypothetical protein